MRSLHVYWILAVATMVSTAIVSTARPALAGSASVEILSAVVRDQKIPDANIIFQKNGERSASGTTDSQGNVQLATDFPDTEDTLLIVKKSGYSTLVVSLAWLAAQFNSHTKWQDWNGSVTADEAAQRVSILMRVWRRGVILFHDIHPKAARAVPT
ncbi:MAG: hypothetical protein WCF85_06835 [Rhodospirillaceae bacterium]